MNAAYTLTLPATFADLAANPDDARLEIVAGEVVEKELATYEHGDCQGLIISETNRRFRRGGDGRPGWYFASEVLVELFDHELYIPDVAGWRRDRHPERPSGRPVRARPDWVCEILSPSTAADDRALKMPFYAQAGIGHLWIVDPLLFTLEVYRLDAGTWRQVGVWRDDAVVQAEPFDAKPLKLARLWGRRTPPRRRTTP